MERYSKWRDGAYDGINPFLPVQTERSMFVVGYVLFAIRFPFIVVFSTIWMALGFWKRNKWIDRVFSRLILFFMGYHRICVREMCVKRGVRPTLFVMKKAYPRADCGDVIVSNSCSYVDFLIHGYL